MTLITFQDGKPLIKDGKVGTGQDCCCGDQAQEEEEEEEEQEEFCDAADTTSQPNVVVSNSSCQCETGSLNGSYAFAGYNQFGGFLWDGNTNCDVQQDNFGTVFFAPMTIQVSCNKIVSVSTYQLGSSGFPLGLSATADGSDFLAVDASGTITGTVTVSFTGTPTCSLTVTFG